MQNNDILKGRDTEEDLGQTKEDICLKGDPAQHFSAMRKEPENTREHPVGSSSNLSLENP